MLDPALACECCLMEQLEHSSRLQIGLGGKYMGQSTLGQHSLNSTPCPKHVTGRSSACAIPVPVKYLHKTNDGSGYINLGSVCNIANNLVYMCEMLLLALMK
jgi:hypothetical protein